MSSVLVVDDEKSLRRMLRQLLEGAGWLVFEACDGNEALRILDEHGADLVIVDIIMPGMDGIETIMAIRRRSPDLAIIAMSGGGAAHKIDYLETARKLGANYILRKPFTVEEVLTLTNEIRGTSE